MKARVLKTEFLLARVEGPVRKGVQGSLARAGQGESLLPLWERIQGENERDVRGTLAQPPLRQKHFFPVVTLESD